MENKDFIDDQPSATDNSTENIDTETAETINGGVTDDAEQTTPADEATEAEPTEPVGSELAVLKDKYLRLYADFENFRRRTAKEKLDLITNANESLLLALLPVVDDFERAMPSLANAKDVNAALEGIQLIYSKLAKTLEAKGLKPMTSKGEVFNADLHESVTQFPAPTDDMKGKVIDEIEKGYLLNDKVIRYAKVIIGA
ncbi:nucleotide exchange factor GrpE [Fibrella aquatilis]|uniref:Protein GrpE n=1 Tax=Fibrella aquatilis TaxID=2817059 RepID=A0A939G3J5_9BACT|nr:nucleotide exchange factor GrpE [Fibrella aquatilis]MBO0929612.1 nucleotide exchange factor GrpE [Fibrella aquatilis]